MNISMSNKALSFEKSLKPKAVEEFLDYYFYRRLAKYLVPILIKLKVSPNQVSILSMFFGLGCAASFYYSQYFLSGLLGVIAIVFDCCDGQIARLTGQSSPLGRMLDGVCDLIWVAALWCSIYFSGYFIQQGMDVFFLMASSGAFTIIHCWRYDAAKIKITELIEPDTSNKNYDVPESIQMIKDALKKGDLLTAFLAFANAFQMYFFIRGSEEKQEFDLSEEKRKQLKKELEPVINIWSYLGEGHHNTLLLLGVFFAGLTPKVFIASFWFMLIPLNIWMVYCEIQYYKKYKQALASISSND